MIEMRVRLGELRVKRNWREARERQHDGYRTRKVTVVGNLRGQDRGLEVGQGYARDNFDSINPGIKHYLEMIEAKTDAVDDAFCQNVASHRRSFQTNKNISRSLKKLTDGEARKVITSIKTENGFVRSTKLHMKLGRSMMSKLGVVLVDFSGLVGRPAQTLEKTCNMITDMERKTEMLDHVTGE